MADPIVTSAIVALIQIISELAKQQNMTADQINEYFLESWKKVQARPAGELPDADG